MLIEKFIEVPNTNIKEPVLSHQFDSELCYQIAEDFGYAEIVWYALNGKSCLLYTSDAADDC